MSSYASNHREMMRNHLAIGEGHFRTHTLWNSRIGQIRPLILRGLARTIFEAF